MNGYDANSLLSEIDGLVFAGGGSRCFWQLGFLASLEERQGKPLTPKAISASSAGTAMACAYVTRRGEQTLASFKEATGRNPRNFYPQRVLRRQPAFPHEQMYRRAILQVLDSGAFERVKTGPVLRLILARAPRWLTPRLAVAAGMGAYALEKRLREPLHPTAGRRLGFSAHVVDANACDTPEALADAILQSSCTPPFTPIFFRDGGPVLDGGLIDVAPVGFLPESVKRPLIMMTRPYKRGLPEPSTEGPVYVGPSHAVPVSKWDYTNPDALQETYDLGRRDGEHFVAQWSIP